MTVPTLPQNSKPTWPALSPELNSLVGLGTNSGAVNELACNPVMLAEARQALYAIRVCATAPAGEGGVQRVVARRLPTYPQTQMSDGQWAAWWQGYYEACGDLPEVALEAGMTAWVRDPTSQFMPKPGQLRELALSTPNRASTAYDRITAAIRQADRPAMPGGEPLAPRGPPPTKDGVAQMLAGYRANVAGRKAAEQARRPKTPPMHGRTDETGITAEMRAVLWGPRPTAG